MNDTPQCRQCGSTTKLFLYTQWLHDEQCLGLLGYLCAECHQANDNEPDENQMNTQYPFWPVVGLRFAAGFLAMAGLLALFTDWGWIAAVAFGIPALVCLQAAKWHSEWLNKQ